MKFANACKLNRKSGVRWGERGAPVRHYQRPRFLALGLGAWMAHADCIKRVVAEQVEGAAIFATEEDVVRTLGHFYGA